MSGEPDPAPQTTADVVRRLRAVGVDLENEGIALERRGDRVMAKLPGGRIAWFAMTPDAAAGLRIEDRVLSLVGARCSFRVPTVLATGPDGWTLRTAVPGAVDPYGFAARLKAEPALVPGTARSLGLALAEQHSPTVEADVAGWLPSAPPWPPPLDDVEVRARLVVDDSGLLRRIARLLDAGRALDTPDALRALVHADFGLHNVAFDPATGGIEGVFDYGGAAWADRHLDFRYLVFAAVPDALLDATMAVYRDATGIMLDRHRVLLHNALAAVAHLADRAGHGADDVVAGRTLAGDLRWTAWALDRCGFGLRQQGAAAFPRAGAGHLDGSTGGISVSVVPDPLAPYLARWRLAPDGDRIATHSSLLLPVTRGKSRAMLKLALDDEEKAGGAVMAWWGGRGAARVLAHDADAVLMERAGGTRSLSAMALGGYDEAATHAICDVLAALHTPQGVPPPLVPLKRWFTPLEAAASSGGTFAASWRSASHLLADPRDIVVLHGDVHHDNILDFGAGGWRAIDPKGLVGERGYDYANLFRNPSEDVALHPGRFERRVALVTGRAGLDPPRLLRWIHAVMGLSAAWQIGEADQPWGPKLSTTLAVADMAVAALGDG